MQSIKNIKAQLALIEDVQDNFLLELANDQRAGVKAALKSWHRQQEKKQARVEQFERMQFFEKQARSLGAKWIAGIDEVGRGPLAGPVVAAAVILPQGIKDLGFDDSKKLSASKRQEIFDKIMLEALAVGVGVVSPQRIDDINIYQASKEAMKEAIVNLSLAPDYLLLDAMNLDLDLPQDSIIKGDAKSISIAAASIIAKQIRDKMMEDYALEFPDYGFERNAGYGTAQHLSALETVGISPIHRKTFAPVKNYL